MKIISLLHRFSVRCGDLDIVSVEVLTVINQSNSHPRDENKKIEFSYLPIFGHLNKIDLLAFGGLGFDLLVGC